MGTLKISHSPPDKRQRIGIEFLAYLIFLFDSMLDPVYDGEVALPDAFRGGSMANDSVIPNRIGGQQSPLI
jgi:hypothetical protein